jgi:N-acetylglucosamine-6-sulfatase
MQLREPTTSTQERRFHLSSRLRTLRMPIIAVCLPALCLAVVLLPGGDNGVSVQSIAKPNIVFILTDDMRKDDLKYMPKTRSLLRDEGMSFQKAYVSNALCCPSRATIMRGQYAHNTGVWVNEPPHGGWVGYNSNTNEQDNVATRLHDAGYRTALIGKYLNGYSGSDVPVGWDKWFATPWFATPTSDYYYYVNDNGTIRHFGTSERDYLTDVLRRQTRGFIDTSIARGMPFFAYVTPIAPHTPATPAPRDLHTYDGEKGPRRPSFNEQDVSDKPPWIQALPTLTSTQIAWVDRLSENRAESLQAVDDLALCFS